MTYITTTEITGDGAEGFRRINDALPTTEPDGLLARYAGTSGDTFVITAVWATKAHWDRFATELLGPTVRATDLPPTDAARTLEYDATDEFVAVRPAPA